MPLQVAVIGENNLLMSCLGDLIDGGFKIAAVFTDTTNAVPFCEIRQIPVFPRGTTIEDAVCAERPDYVFSINNPRILTPAEIRVARCMSINYHDSLLPRYSGCNATCWAIMNGETTHGISWHVVETGIDTGDILRSEEIEIFPTDTVFSLNLKCQESARKAFKMLLQDIQDDDLHPVAQDLSLRTYNSMNKLLPTMGVIDFNASYDTLFNFVRALEYGQHENMVGVPKLRTPSGEYVMVEFAEPVSSQCDDQPPGRVLQVLEQTVVVTTETTPIKLHLAQLTGSPILPRCFQDLGLVPGQSIQPNLAISEDPHLEMIRKKEAFWRKKLISYEPTTFFTQKMNVFANITDPSHMLNLAKTTICEFEPNSDMSYLQASFLAFLARVCCVSEVSIGFLSNLDSVPSDVRPMYVTICPCHFTVKLSAQSKDEILKLQIALKQHHLDKAFLRDLFHRHPIMKPSMRSPFHNLVIGQDNGAIPEHIFHECNMLLLFGSERNTLVAIYNIRHGQNYRFMCNTLKHFPTFLSSLESSVSLQLSNICLISKDEMRQHYTRCEDDTTASSETTLLIKAVEKRFNETPHRIAIKTTDISLTHKQCQKYVTKLHKWICKTLSKSKLTETATIAIHMPNSIHYVLAVLAILKCGMSFLPIPDDYPSERVKFILNDSNVRVMLRLEEVCSSNDSFSGSTEQSRTSICGSGVSLISWDQLQDVNESIIHCEPRKEYQTCDETCYIMYTSGSTGRPKGVRVKQSSVVYMAEAQIEKWDLDESDVIAQFASIGFDASISEIFTALLSGGTLAIIEKDQRHGHEFVRAIARLGVTTMTLPPSVINIYSPTDLPTIRKLVTAGEACTLRIATKWSNGTSIRIFNAYGPTETTVCATMYEFNMDNQMGEVNQDLPIGKAIARCHVYLFDDFMQPVPSGVVGQMFIGGRCLSAGYIGHAHDRNVESFVQNPLSNKNELLYRTGDHAVRDEDGVITFVGRVDNQVKIRGKRIDLSEIEQVLIQHSMVQIAVVVVHTCAHSNQQALCAFIAPDFVFLSELREYLAKVLPKYMVPTYIKKLKNDDFPMTANGKVNRYTLSRDETVHERMSVVGHSHLNETQLSVARLWCEVLRLDESQAYTMHRMSSFSELGGNSIHLVLLQRILIRHFKVPLTFTDIGSVDTIEELALVIQKKRENATPNTAVVHRKSSQLATLVGSDAQLNFNAVAGKLLDVEIGLGCSPPVFGKTIPMTILISGVTGFLGAHLLSELLKHTIGNICCMVRETTEVKGYGRVVENLRKYGLWKFEYSNRIAIVISDLSQERLGISPDIYEALTNDVDSIFINAAVMNFNGSYELHREANVNSTKEFIKFAVTNKRKFLFLTSSLSVFLFPPTPPETAIMESDTFSDPTQVEGGYGLSKWASEKLVLKALDHLPGGAVFRPARISGHSIGGRGPTNDLFASSLIGMKRMGSYPDLTFPYDLTPVDYCAKSMIEIACQLRLGQGGDRRVFHIFNKNTIPFNDLFKGMGLRALTLADWREELRHVSKDNIELLPLTPFFMSRFWDRSNCWPVFDTGNTDSLTCDATKQLLRPTAELLEIYKRFYRVQTLENR